MWLPTMTDSQNCQPGSTSGAPPTTMSISVTISNTPATSQNYNGASTA